MNIKKTAFIIAAFLAAFIVIAVIVLRGSNDDEIDVVALNDISQTLAHQWDMLDKDNLPCLEYGLDYVVLDSGNRFIAATKNGLNNDYKSAVVNRDTIIDIRSDGTIIGKLIIYNETRDILRSYKNDIFISSVALMTAAAMLCFFYTVYIDKSIFRPFRKLQSFARHVAQGNLDMPLEMDKSNLFGAFSESFDLMREELGKARENERRANQSKKELVASLSHDIKTPVASIKAVSELLHAKSVNEDDKKQFEIINVKADQIDTLISNLFNATLEELHELKVNVTEQSSKILRDLILNADYNNRITIANIPDCIISIDELRLSQVIDNIISNSYKYAGTSIDVSLHIKDEFLEIIFKDFGLGVPEDEMPLIFNKYYRAQNSSGKNGTGLGLFISKYLMNKMSGDISCEMNHDGFSVIIKILIS